MKVRFRARGALPKPGRWEGTEEGFHSLALLTSDAPLNSCGVFICSQVISSPPPLKGRRGRERKKDERVRRKKRRASLNPGDR